MRRNTITIHGSDEVMAALSDFGTFYRGEWQDVQIKSVSEDKDIPLNVRKSLVGLTVPTIFGKEQLESQGVKLPIPENSRLAYVPDVVDALKSSGKYGVASELERVSSDPLDMYVFEGGIYDLAKPPNN